MSEELSLFCRNFSDGVAKIAFYVTLAFFSVEMIFLEKCFFHHFRTLNEKISATSWVSTGPALVTALYSSRETLWGQVNSLRNFVFVNILGHWTKSFRPSGKNCLAESSKLHSTCPEEHFGVFLKKLDVVNHIRTLSDYRSAYWLNFPNGPWRLLPTFREEHFTDFFYFWICIEILVQWGIKFPAFRQKFLCRVFKAAF